MNRIEELKNNPIFAMSLSSKELFHSNFWLWLFERNIAYAKTFFPDLKEIKAVTREQGHRDITIWQTETLKKKSSQYDDAYVIENKFKSIPTKEQLIRYQAYLEDSKNESNNKSFLGGVLTGIEKPDFMDDLELDKWKFISYNEIGDNIKFVAEKVEKDGFEKDLIINYSKMIQDLYGVLSDSVQNSNNAFIPYIEELGELRINDIYSKLLSSKLENYLKENLNIDKDVSNYKLVLRSYYSRNAGIDIRYVDENSNDLTVIGIQIEKNQYRWCIQIPKSTASKISIRTQYIERYIKNGWFVKFNSKEFKKGNKAIKDHITNEPLKTSLSKEYDVYDSNNKNSEYTFLYQYWTINERSSFEFICEHVKRDMEFAKQILLQG